MRWLRRQSHLYQDRLACSSPSSTTIVTLLCLVADIALMLRENVPINGVIDRWSPANPPRDWDVHRSRWFAIFAYRQVILLVGFVSLLIGAVFQG